MQLIQLVFATATSLLGPSSPGHHLLAQLGDHEKTVASIEHQIAKAEYNENHPSASMIFDNPFPLVWLPHSCGSECRNEFIRVKEMVLELHSASVQNKFKAAYAILKESPELADFVDAEGNTLLHHAIKGKNVNLVIALFCIRPQLVTLKNNEDKTPIHLALANNPRKILLFLRAAYATK